MVAPFTLYRVLVKDQDGPTLDNEGRKAPFCSVWELWSFKRSNYGGFMQDSKSIKGFYVEDNFGNTGVRLRHFE